MADRNPPQGPPAVFPEVLDFVREELAKDRLESNRRFEEMNQALALITRLVAPQAARPSAATPPEEEYRPEPFRAANLAATPERPHANENVAARRNFFRAAAREPARTLHFGESGTLPQSKDWEESSPLVDQVRWEEAPMGFREPRLPSFTGRDDPVSHLQAFESAVSMRVLSDGLRTKLLATSFSGEAREWFYKLPAQSLTCFADLRKAFLIRFATSKKRKSGPATLFKIQQQENETLAHYIDRFQEEILGIEAVDSSFYQVALESGLKEGPLKFEVTTYRPGSYQELIAIANRFIEGEISNPRYLSSLLSHQKPAASSSSVAQNNQSYRPYIPQAPRGRNYRNNRPFNNFRRFDEVRPQVPPPAPQPKIHPAPPKIPPTVFYNDSQESFADLPLPVCEILQIIQSKPFFQRPGPLKSDVGTRNPGFFCEYHKERGHQTENCRALRFLIDKLLREGKIQGLIANKVGEKAAAATAAAVKGKGIAHVHWASEDVNDIGSKGAMYFGSECVEADDEGPSGRLFCIHGGAGVESSRKASINRISQAEVAFASEEEPSRDVVTFGREDMPPFANPFNDAVVIKAVIEDYTVEKILADTGSSVNLLFKRTFEALKTGKVLLSTEGPLYGFSGEKKETEGRLLLIVTMGGIPKQIEFIVVDAPSSYYAIFGRPLLNAYGAVVSTLHMALKFSVKGKQFRVRGSPRQARECYVKAVNNIEQIETLGSPHPPSFQMEEGAESLSHQLGALELSP